MTEQNKGGALTSVPKSVQSELLQLNRPPQAISMPEPRLRIAAHDVDAVEFFGSCSRAPATAWRCTGWPARSRSSSGRDPDRSAGGGGRHVRLRRAAQGNVFHVYPAGLRTETIPVNYLMMSRRGLPYFGQHRRVASNDNNSSNNNNFDNANNSTNNSASNRSSNGNSNSDSNGTRIETDTNSDYWTDLRDTLQTLIGSGDGRAVITSPQAGLVTIRAYPKELKAVREFLNQSESHLKRQVVLRRGSWRWPSTRVTSRGGLERSPPAGMATRALLAVVR